jgi:signal transduction histidine kinase/DNA-binding response OmpR family regulator
MPRAATQRPNLGAAEGSTPSRETEPSARRGNGGRRPRSPRARVRLADHLGGTLSLPDVLDGICRLMVEAIPCDRCVIYLWNQRHEAVVPTAQHGTPAHLIARFVERPLERDGLVADRVNAGEVLVISRDDPRTPERLRPLEEAELHSLAILPFSAPGMMAGSLALGLSGPPGFTAAALETARDLAAQAAQLIATARLFTKAQKAAAFRARVTELAIALNAWNDQTVINRLVCKRGAELFGVDTGVFFQRVGERLVAIAEAGLRTNGQAMPALPLDDESIPVVRAFRTALPVFVNDIPTDWPDAWPLARELGFTSLLAVPLVGSAGTAGCLVYGDTSQRHAFSQGIADEGTLFAAVATGAIERAHRAHAEHARRGAELQAVELTRRAQELTEARNAALAAAQAKAEFLANMSHEIRTPMTAILGYLNLVSHPDTTPGERDGHIATIRQNGEHLLRILNDILDLSKIEAGKMTVERADCSPIQLLGEIASLMRPRATEKRLQFVLASDGAVPERIHADPTRVRQVLINLVSNAIKFTEAGEVRLRISLIGRPSDGRPMLRFDVGDTGIGLSSDAIDKLFAPFTQADASMARRFGGTGLGLAISKRLAQMLGGDIVVTSTPGEGSVFSFTVETGCLDGVTLLQDPNLEAAAMPPARVETSDLGAPLRARVLLAEDTPDVQRLFAYYLRSAGAVVEVADNGIVACERALAAAAAGQPFDVILMDMQMPELDGEQATMRLRRAGYTGPIIALTAHTMQSEREKCERAGCDDFLSKPTDPATLAEAIRRNARIPDTAETSPAPVVSTLNGDAELMELLAMFVAGLPERVSALERSLELGDLGGLTRQAHQLKGTAASYGFVAIAEVAGHLETNCKESALDAVRRQVSEVADLCRRARVRAESSTNGHPASAGTANMVTTS